MNQYIYILQMLQAASTMSKDKYEKDLVLYAMDSMDPEIKTHLEANHSDHLQSRARDYITQIRALQKLQGLAEKSKAQVMSTCQVVNKASTTALLSVPGYAANAANDTTFTPAFKFVAEQTIQDLIPPGNFDWKKGQCFRCGKEKCKWAKDGVIVCPQANRPGVKIVSLSQTLQSPQMG